MYLSLYTEKNGGSYTRFYITNTCFFNEERKEKHYLPTQVNQCYRTFDSYEHFKHDLMAYHLLKFILCHLPFLIVSAHTLIPSID